MKSLVFPRFGLLMMPVMLVNCLSYYPGGSAFFHLVYIAYGYFTNAVTTNLIVKPFTGTETFC